ncbi:MAG TPA: hypothetical protein VFM58_16700 [Solirubrobacteraceae bacterium]|nr:hypothetical protein [Solirubrobacteraceae bacterium]
MPAKPNFTRVDRRGGAIVVTGQTDPEPEGDILAIHVVLSQGGHSVAGTVGSTGANWDIELPAEGFDAGAAMVAGTETRRENATTITWAQSVQIP